ncbi:deoxynucleoside kinase [candidate division TA06 bacterium]|nr:deoxynucleoside kinase [candidate division TA06 bacterium]
MAEWRYVSIEGVIGVGKTALAKRLAKRLRARLILEEVDENPFLSSFYRDMKTYALQTQLFFLLSRHRQQRELSQMDLFSQRVVTDYLFAKEKIFAYLNLDDHELTLYERIFSFIEKDAPTPDFVIYLQATPRELMRRIQERGRPYEQEIQLEYLVELSESYNRFFFHFDATPLLVVNVEEIDFVRKEEDFEDLYQEIQRPFSGTRFYVPAPRR